MSRFCTLLGYTLHDIGIIGRGKNKNKESDVVQSECNQYIFNVRKQSDQIDNGLTSPDLKKRMVKLIEKNVALRKRRAPSIAARSIRNARTLRLPVVRFLESGMRFYGIFAVDPARARSRLREITSVLAVSRSEAATAALRGPMLLCLEEGGLEAWPDEINVPCIAAMMALMG
jgi:hypothetical protein